jgi:exopolysaccharide biosynthesis polyprenyl glycosylphosphotransferase
LPSRYRFESVPDGTVTPPRTEGDEVARLAASLPPRDVRRKRPPALSFVLRLETARRVARVASLLALDFLGIWGALVTALVIKIAIKGGAGYAVAFDQARQHAPFAFLLTVLLFARSDLYAERARRPGLPRIIAALFQVTVVALIYALASGQHFDSYYVFYGSLFFAIAYIAFLRLMYEHFTGWLLTKAGYRRRTIIVGRGEHIEEVGRALSESARSPVEIVGSLSLTPRADNGLRSLGLVSDLPRVLADHRVEEVVIADPNFPQDRAVELADTCHSRGVTVHVAPSTMEVLLQRAEFVPGQSVPLFTLKPPVFDGLDFALKRVFDLAVASALLLLLSPVLALIALTIKLTSRGPVLYRSMRPGMGGEPFPCLKFRTMFADAEQRQRELEHRNEAVGAIFKIRRDPRVTLAGRVLRRFSLDELPQLVNVLRGEMSLVGPRPLPIRDYERLEAWHRKRYLVLPGMTGLWQVSGRDVLDFDELVRLDFLYLERWSIFLDLTILLKTVPAVLSRRGAY